MVALTVEVLRTTTVLNVSPITTTIRNATSDVMPAPAISMARLIDCVTYTMEHVSTAAAVEIIGDLSATSVVPKDVMATNATLYLETAPEVVEMIRFGETRVQKVVAMIALTAFVPKKTGRV